MRTLLLFFVLAIAAGVPANGQAIRFDSASYTTSASCVSGKQCPVLALPGTQVNFCQGTPGSLAGCLSSPATTYTNASAVTPCATTSQLTPATGGACLPTTDAQGNYGAWLLPGSYGYYLRVPVTAGGGTYGPYPFTVHGDSGGYTLDSLYTNLSAAVTAAGSGTLAITKAWNATPTQSLATANVLFLGNGKIQPSNGAVVTFGKITAVSNQQIFDVSLSGATGIVFSQTPAQTYPEWFGADPTGVAESLLAIQSAVTASAAVKGCTWFTGPQYKVTGGVTGPALGQACLKANYNAASFTGTLSGNPPRAASLIQQQNSAKTISLAGLSNVVDGLDFTIATGVTGVTAIYGTDTLSQPFAHNRITNNTIHGFSSGVTAGTHLAAGIDIESIGANANNNTITGNVTEVADSCYILHGASSSAVVNANIFHNWANNCNDAALLTNAGEMGTFWLSMEGNVRAVTGVGVVASSFYLDNGEQAPPHLILSGQSHDNTLWSAQRNRNGGQIGMTVTADSLVNNLADLSGIWQGVSTTGQRYWCFGCVTESSNYTPNLAQAQWQTDTSGTRALMRFANSGNQNTISDMSLTPQGCDALGYCGYYFSTTTAYDYTKPVRQSNQRATTGDNHNRVFDSLSNNDVLMSGIGGQYLNSAASLIRGVFLRSYDNSGNAFDPLFGRGDGGIQVAPSAQGTCNSANAGGAAGNDAGTLFTSGVFRYVQSGPGIQDHLYFCAKDSGNTYAWRTIY